MSAAVTLPQGVQCNHCDRPVLDDGAHVLENGAYSGWSFCAGCWRQVIERALHRATHPPPVGKEGA